MAVPGSVGAGLDARLAVFGHGDAAAVPALPSRLDPHPPTTVRTPGTSQPAARPTLKLVTVSIHVRSSSPSSPSSPACGTPVQNHTLSSCSSPFRCAFVFVHCDRPRGPRRRRCAALYRSEPYDPYLPRGGSSTGAGAGPAAGNSKTAAIQQQIDDTVGIMRENITKVAERGERLDQLQDKTDNLAVSAQGFRRGANRVRKVRRPTSRSIHTCPHTAFVRRTCGKHDNLYSIRVFAESLRSLGGKI